MKLHPLPTVSSPASILALLLLLPAAAAIAVDSFSYVEGTDGLKLQPLHSEKAKHNPELHAKAQVKPDVHDKAQHKPGGHGTEHQAALHGKVEHKAEVHGKSEHKATLHDKAQHKPEEHGKSEQITKVHDKVQHKPKLHGKSELKTTLHDKAQYKAEVHGKSEQTTKVHDKAQHKPELHGKSEHKATLHGTAQHKSEIHGKSEHKAALHDKAQHKTEVHGSAEHKAALQDKAQHKADMHVKSEHNAALHDKVQHKTELHGKSQHKSAFHDKAQHKADMHVKSEHNSALHDKVQHKTELHGKSQHKSALHDKSQHTADMHVKSEYKSALDEKGQHTSSGHHNVQHKAALHGKTQHNSVVHDKEHQQGKHEHKSSLHKKVHHKQNKAEANEGESLCEDVVNGSKCFTAVTWLRRDGFKLHPEWYPAYGAHSTFQEVQAMLFSLTKSDCPRPCTVSPPISLNEADSSKVIEIDGSGRQVYSEGHALVQPAGCRDAQEGEYCFSSILWLAAKGIRKHPEWYPNLSITSTVKDVQEELFRDNKSDCARPCLAESGAAKRFRLSNPALKGRDPAGEVCKDVAPGSKCHVAVTRGLTEGVKKHPDQYPGLPPRADFRDIQENLHLRSVHHCPRPCPLRSPDQPGRPENATGTGGEPPVEDMTLEELVAHVGRASSRTTKVQALVEDQAAEAGPSPEDGRPKAGSTVHFNVQAEEEEDAPKGPVLSPAPAREPEASPVLALNAEPAPTEPSGPPRTAPALQNPANSVDDEVLPRLDRNAVEIL